MATAIEFISKLDGRDEVPLSRNRNVFRQLREILEAFQEIGYRVFGDIYYQDEKFEGEYRLVSSKDEIIVSIH